jgi:hypothetical protein
MRRVLLALLIAVAFVVAGCGGGGAGSSSTSGPRATPVRSTETYETSVEVAAERRAAGRAAPFVIANSDNSVPTFGSEAGAAERRRAERGLKAYLSAREAEDWATACRGLAVPTRRGFGKLAKSSATAKSASCTMVLPALSKHADLTDPLTAGLLSLRVEGSNGFALFYGPGHQQYIAPMHREGGAWRPTQAAPIAYPPGASG